MAKKKEKGPKKERKTVADTGSKRLIGLAPTPWLQWITKLSNVKAGKIIEGEFQWITRHSDALVEASTPEHGQFLVLNEMQLRPDPQMPRRMRAYCALAEEKYKLSVYPVLINILPPGANTQIPTKYDNTFLGKRALQEYDVINLWEMDAELALKESLAPLLPFVPIMKGGDNEKLIRQALTKLRADENLKEMEALLAFFASFVMESKVLKQIMRWDMVVLSESPWYEQILEEGRSEGREEVRREAHRQVIERERQAVMRQLLRVLTHGFGEMPEELLASLRKLDTSSLEALVGVALSAPSLAQFQQHPLFTGSS